MFPAFLRTRTAFLPGLVLAFLAGLLMIAGESQALPQKHEAYLAQAAYRQAYSSYEAMLAEAQKRLDEKDLARVRLQVEQVMGTSVREDVKGGIAEQDAWITAFMMGREAFSQELVHDYLCRHREGVQGFYRLKSKTVDGWLAVQKGEKGIYAVSIFAGMTIPPFQSGIVEGYGILNGKAMKAFDKNHRENPLLISFDGDKATVKETPSFKKAGVLGRGVSADGTYTREKR